MTDNGSPFVVWMPGMPTKFGKTLRELEIRHIRTQINSRAPGVVAGGAAGRRLSLSDGLELHLVQPEQSVGQDE